MFLYAARQPLLDREQNLIAYEIIFRNGNFFEEADAATAASKLVAASQFEKALPDLTAGKPAHVKFSYQSLVRQYPTMIPTDQLVIEITEVTTPDEHLLKECKALKEDGYNIVISGHDLQDWSEYFPYVAMMKLDFSRYCDDDLLCMREAKERHSHLKLIGANIDNTEQFFFAKAAGFDYFQGQFFCQYKPLESVSEDENDYSLAELLFEVSNLIVDSQELIDKVQTDENLKSHILHYSNSSHFKSKNTTIEQALARLGKEELIKAVSIVFTAQISSQAIGSKSPELLTISLTRAKFAEELAAAYSKKVTNKTSVDRSAAFLTGMFSLIDVMLDQPLSVVIEKLKLTEKVSGALLQNQGELASLIEITRSYEKADWLTVELICIELCLTREDVAQSYKKAVQHVLNKVGENK